MKLVLLPPEKLAEALPLIEPFARKMAERYPDDWPVRTIVTEAHRCRLQLWLVWEPNEKKAYGLVGTQVVEKASGRTFLDIPLTAGHDPALCMEVLRDLEDYGRKMGCERLDFYARKGWSRALMARGYEAEPMARMTKEL